MKLRSAFVVIVLLTVFVSQLCGEDTIRAHTEDGKGVLLHEDGTWAFSGRIGFFDVERNGITSVNEISISNTKTGDIVIRQVFNEGRVEYVELWNRSGKNVDLSEWYLMDEQRNRIVIPPGTEIPENENLYVVSGQGPPPAQNYVQTTHASIWNNSGDSARLFDEDGKLVAEHSY